MPVTMGVLTVETMAQALERANGTCGNVVLTLLLLL